MKKAIILIFIFVILVSIPIVTFKSLEFKTFLIKNLQQEENDEPSPKENTNKKFTSPNTNSINEESPNSQQPANQQDCSLIQISYALKNLAVNEVCNSFQQQTCIDKTVTCSLEVQNLDNQISGNFKINFNFVNEQEQVLSAKQHSENVEANSIKIFSVEQTFASPEASQQISCMFNTLEVPRREICG